VRESRSLPTGGRRGRPGRIDRRRASPPRAAAWRLIRPERLQPPARSLVSPLAVVVLLRERERLAVVGLRLLGVGFALPGEAAARVGPRMLRIQMDRRRVVRNRAVEVALLAQLDGAIVVDAGELGPGEAPGGEGGGAGREGGFAVLGEAPFSAVAETPQGDRRNRQHASRDQRRRTQRNSFHGTRPGYASASCR